MHIVVRRLEWDALHRVPDHAGACKAFHGHRYVAEIEVGAMKLDELGMVIDLSILKEVIGAWIDRHFDHTAILWKRDPDPAIAAIAQSNEGYGKHVYFMDLPPTVENIAAELGQVCIHLLQDHPVLVLGLRVWETPNCSAIWRNPDIAV